MVSFAILPAVAAWVLLAVKVVHYCTSVLLPRPERNVGHRRPMTVAILGLLALLARTSVLVPGPLPSP
jgi:hypothetical protein